jgi:hypothetical protein
MLAAIPTPPDECYRCGYDLRGIEDTHPCPECGLLAQRSRRVSDELHNTRPKWLRTIALGSNLMLLAIILAGTALPIWTNYLQPSPSYVGAYWGTFWIYSPKSLVLIELSPALLLWLGIFLLTRREGYPPADQADQRLRFWLRIVAAAPMGILLIQLTGACIQWLQLHQSSTAWGSYNADPAGWEYVLMVLEFAVVVAGVLLPFLLFRHFGGLAKRARSAHLAEHCNIVGIGASASIFYCVTVIFLLSNPRQVGVSSDWMVESETGLIMLLIFLTAAFLFTLWCLYLLVGFAIAFNKAARQLRGKWKHDDLSVQT